MEDCFEGETAWAHLKRPKRMLTERDLKVHRSEEVERGPYAEHRWRGWSWEDRETENWGNVKKFQGTGLLSSAPKDLTVCLGFSHESPYTREQPVQPACPPGLCDIIRCGSHSNWRQCKSNQHSITQEVPSYVSQKSSHRKSKNKSVSLI